MKPSRRAISSKSITAYPRTDRTAHAEDFPVPGVPVIATIIKFVPRDEALSHLRCGLGLAAKNDSECKQNGSATGKPRIPVTMRGGGQKDRTGGRTGGSREKCP